MNLDAPTDLPGGLKHLSHSSLELFMKCPEKWRRRYIDNEYEPPVGIMVLGRAVHSAEAQNLQRKKDTGELAPLQEVLDIYDTAYANELSQEAHIDWQEHSADGLKDSGAGLLRAYQSVIAPALQPLSVESEFHIRLPGANWTIKGYIDMIGSYDDGGIIQTPVGPHDIKTVGKAIDQATMDSSPQATLYTYATLQEGIDTIPFVVHELKTTKGGQARLVHTERTRDQGLRYLSRVASIVRQIDRCMESGDWPGAPPNGWWCREKTCGYWMQCDLVPHL